MNRWCRSFGLECHALGSTTTTNSTTTTDNPLDTNENRKKEPSLSSSMSTNNADDNELSTLQHVYQHCRRLGHHRPNNQNHTTTTTSTEGQEQQRRQRVRVGYMHNKGSYHPSELNDQWRYLMTEAAMSRPDCWPTEDDDDDDGDYDADIRVDHKMEKTILDRSTATSTSHHHPCNVCGLYLTTDRGLYMSGNIWTADCDYIDRLIEPQQYRIKMEQIAQEAFAQRLTGDVIMTQYPNDEPSYFGVGRYAAEWWIGSHPSLQVCDYSPSLERNKSTAAATSTVGYDRTKDFLNFVAETGRERQVAEQQHQPYSSVLTIFTKNAPHFPYKLPKPKALKTKMTEDPNAMKREFFLLPGLLYRWIHLYQMVPPQDSWVWNHYPEGMWWREAALAYNTTLLQAWKAGKFQMGSYSIIKDKV